MPLDAAQRKHFGIALLVFAVALLARIPFLGRAALWGDEILFVQYMADVSLSPWRVFLGYWRNCIDFGQLPLAGVVLNAWLQVVGRFIPDVSHHVLALRIPGALAGAFAVVVAYWLGRRLVRPEVNRVATAMAVCFYYPVFYSREVYCYPYVLLCAAGAFLFFHKSLFDEPSTWTTVPALFLWSTGLGLTHFGCSAALAAMGVISGHWWLWNIRMRRPALARQAAWTLGTCVLAGLVVTPYWVRILLGDSPHIASESPIPLLGIVNDMVSKFFLGDRPLPALLAWLLLVAGLASLGRGTRTPAASRTAAGLFVLTAIVLAILAKKSAYPSSRYFAMLAPLVYVVFAEGLWTVAQTAARLFRRAGAARIWFRSLAAGAVLIHVGLFLPNLYRLEEKSVPYATTARWLNQNGVPGAPYFFDCGGFDFRYVPGYYPTPGLIPTVQIAGNGPGFMPDVHNVQRRLMAQFPVSFYIRNPAHPWDEAERFYRNAMEYRNPFLRRLRRYGIVTDVDTRDFNADTREILYNTRADAVAIATEAGLPVYVDYPRFRCAQIAGETYGRVVDGREAELIVHNLRETPIQGAFRVTGAISATNPSSPVRLTLPTGKQMDILLPCAEIWTLETPLDQLPTGASTLLLAVSNPLAEKLLITDVQFVER